MNPVQSKIEQTAKEYLTYKALADKEAEIVKKDKDNFAKKAEQVGDEDAIYELYFDSYGSLELLIKDMLLLKTKLYNQIELAKDVFEVPKEISALVEDFKQPLMFAIIGDEKKIIELELYNQYRNQYVAGAKQIAKLNSK